MVRRQWWWGAALAALIAWGGAARAQQVEDPRNVEKFFAGLRDRGYYDLAGDYLESIRKVPGVDPELVSRVDYEQGRLLVDEASKTGDLVRRRELLDMARGKLEGFTKANPKSDKAPDALTELARLLVERGHLAMLLADDTDVKADKEAKLSEARSAFDQARAAYDTADKSLSDAYAKFPPFIPDGDAQKAQREARDATHNALMQVQLQKAVVDYEQGQTYSLGSKERTDLMTKALAQFEELYKKYRTFLAGLAARMWQAKCYEERGDLGPAMGIYNELMEHADPRLRGLQRYVGYFRIIVIGKRKEYALAADEAVRWLQANNSQELLRSKEGIGVQFELAKNLVAQLPKAESEQEKNAATKKIIDTLGYVVRYPSPFKSEAIELLKKYKPSAAVNLTEVAKLSYDDALAQAEQALASHEWDRAIELLRQAIRRAEAAKDVDKLNAARFKLAFAYYQDKRYYEADVLAEHLARRYPQGGLSPQAAEIGMASLIDAYNTYTQIDHSADLNHLVDLAKYTAEAFPERDQGDNARLMLGQIYHGMGKYDEAVAAFESVRPKSGKFTEGLNKAGGSHWVYSQKLRRDGKTTEADAEVKKALDTLDKSLAARREAGATPTDGGLMGTVCDIADIHLETGKPEVALKVSDPIVAAQAEGSSPEFIRLMSMRLRAHVGMGQVDQAVSDMGKLERAGGSGARLTQLYFELGKLLDKEMDALKKRGDSAGLNRTRQAFQKFLGALVQSKSGQTYESLQWAGEQMLALQNPKEAEGVFRQVLKTYENDAKFAEAPGGAARLTRTRLKLVGALRGQQKIDEAKVLLDDVLAKNPRGLEPLFEKGMFLEEQAKSASKPNWNVVFAHWRNLAMELGKARTKPVEYYDAWYHAAQALQKDGKAKEAKQTLASIMRLSATVGGPEMKQKYKTLMDEIK